MDQTDFSQKSINMESEFERIENGQHPNSEDNGPSYSADHGGQLKSMLKKVHKSAVAGVEVAHETYLDYQKC